MRFIPIRHRHRFIASPPEGLIQVFTCRTRRCGYTYEQCLLFDLAAYAA